MSEKTPQIEIVDTARFARWARKARVTSSVERLAAELRTNPMSGDVIPGYRGLRKVRMAGAGRGKRGGFRVVYTVLIDSTLLVLLDGFSKSDKEDLTADELSALLAQAAVVEVQIRAERAAALQQSEG